MNNVGWAYIRAVNKNAGIFDPVMSTSVRWVEWVSQLSPTTCAYCRNRHGCIFEKGREPGHEIPVHPFCMCALKAMTAIRAGTATVDREEGADYYVKMHGTLPDEYLTQDEARALGWARRRGDLREVCGNISIGGDIFKNSQSKLPDTSGRIWYEADINYTGGFRNSQRVLYSNDGLVFVTYDHYMTFYEII